MTRPPKTNANDDDRRVLLRRRALFLSAAVAATACGSGGAKAPEDPSAVNVEPIAGEPTEGSAKPPKRNTPPDAAAPPPIETPADASDQARHMYKHLQKAVTRIQVDVAGLARSMLNCSLKQCQSDPAVEQLARAYATASHLISELTPLCPGSSQEAKDYETVVKEQQGFFRAKLKLYRDEMMKRMSRDGDFSDRFGAALSRANASQPSVCLDCGDW